MEPFPPLDLFCISGLEAGRALGKPYHVHDSDQDLSYEAACEIRDFVNYVDGRLMQMGKSKGPGELERTYLLTALSIARNLYRVMEKAREYQLRGGV